MRTFSIRTLGCKVNQYESQLIREGFLGNGFREVNPVRNGKISNGVNGKEPADVYVINTCTVTGRADKNSRHLIRNACHLNPGAKIVVTGCLTERDSEAVLKIDGVTDIIKNSDKNKLFSLTISDKRSTINDTISAFEGHDRPFVKIQDGCNNHCSYCKVSLVRGRSRSRHPEEIKKEIDTLVANGFKEIVLTGVCLGEWGEDLKGSPELCDLIKELDEIDGKFRLRLSSIELKYVSDRLIKLIAGSERLCRHLHIPVQSGDSHILKLMDRSYTEEEFRDGILKIKSIIPEFGFTTDVLVGFPGEEEKHFYSTVELLTELRPHRLHVFTYSRREGTKAAGFENAASHPEAKRRMRILVDRGKEFSYDYRKTFLGKEVEVLIEEKRDKATQLLTGYTDTYIRVLMDGADTLKGHLIKCRVCEVSPSNTLVNI